MKTLKDFKTRLSVHSIWDCFDSNTGKIKRRRVGLRQGNAVGFNSPDAALASLAWLYWPKASQLTFLPALDAVRVENDIMGGYLVYAKVESMDAPCRLEIGTLANGTKPEFTKYVKVGNAEFDSYACGEDGTYL